jgi:alginate O-acetyltransferase complex protein AlgI
VVFASPLFLFAFLPLALALYYLTPTRARNFTLLCLSLVFYAWGEREWVVVMLASVVFNWLGAMLVDALTGHSQQRRVLGLLVALNLAALGYFKYADFALQNVSALFVRFGASPLGPLQQHLPLGISFFTFHAISYVVDVYRGQSRALKNPLDTALYIALFPQLIAGPIIRYHYIEHQLKQRGGALEDLEQGIRLFVIGLAKKVLIANVVARAADQVFALPPEQLSLGVSWLGVVCYALQIYFDFSGYSDMAVGLGRLFGFRFPENFDHPYSSRSITEFWRRWHISLSSWFRDYLYIPLGGNRLSPARTYLNLVTVFLLCGLWHGASWTFVLWGALHGSFLVLERAGFGKRLASAPGLLQRSYALLVVLVGWVFFRADSLGQALMFLKAMAGGSGLSTAGYPVALYATPAVLLAGVLGVFFSFPVPAPAARIFATREPERLPAWLTRSLAVVLTFVLFGLSAASLASHTYNPFIYFRF